MVKTTRKRKLGFLVPAVIIVLILTAASAWIFQWHKAKVRDDAFNIETWIEVSNGSGGTMLVPEAKLLPVSTFKESEFFANGSYIGYSGNDYTVMRGVDVSYYQGDIDWQAVAQEGVEFAVIRAGYRGYQDGEMYGDELFKKNIEGAIGAGLKVGVYFFSQAVSEEEAVQEANYTLEMIKGYNITMPVVFDWEHVDYSTARTDNMDGSTLTKCALAFCNTVKAAGYEPTIYFNRSLGYNTYKLNYFENIKLWVSAPDTYPDFYYEHYMWQYSFSGRVNGISGNTDMNLCFIKSA